MSMSIAFVLKGLSWNFRRSGQIGRDQRRLEPYVLAFCADGDGQIHHSMTPIYANSPRVGRQQMTGTGHIFYGPKDPRGVLVFAAAVVESDADIRDAGARMDAILSGGEVRDRTRDISAHIVAAASAAGSTTLVGQVVAALVETLHASLQIVARAMHTDPDDVEFVDSGSFLASTTPPYHWGRRLEAHSPRQVFGRPAFTLEYEVLRVNESLHREITSEVGGGYRSLPSVLRP